MHCSSKFLSQELKLDFNDVLIVPQKSKMVSRADVDLNTEYRFKHSSHVHKGIPILSSNMDQTGTFMMCEALAQFGLTTVLHKHNSLDSWRQWIGSVDRQVLEKAVVSMGISDADCATARSILALSDELRMLCVDVANGYTDVFENAIRRVREEFGRNITIMAGNVVTPEVTEELIKAGCDCVKLGIGPGSVCTTRKKTGIGYPQLSCILECAPVAHELGGRVISDGGCTCSGDVVKAFGAGADYVMLGGMFAGHLQSGCDVVEVDGKKYCQFYGMSSDTAMHKYHGGVADYRASEGKTVSIQYKGDVRATVQDMLGGLRSACTYVGAATLAQFEERVRFVRTKQQTNEVFSTLET